MKKILYLIAVSTLLITACKKQALVENTVYEKVNPGDPKYAYVKILNVTPGSPTINYFMDGTKFSAGLSSLSIENAGYAYNGIFPSLGYAITSPGAHTLTAKIIPTATADAGLQVFNAPITTDAGKYYTLFTTGQYSTTKVIPTYLMVEDTKPALDTAKIFIRLVNLCNGGPSVDIIKGTVTTGPKIASNITYGTVSNWAEIVSPGNGATPSNSFMLVNSSTGIALTGALSFALNKGSAYTIYLRGILGSTTFPPTFTYYTTFY